MSSRSREHYGVAPPVVPRFLARRPPSPGGLAPGDGRMPVPTFLRALVGTQDELAPAIAVVSLFRIMASLRSGPYDSQSHDPDSHRCNWEQDFDGRCQGRLISGPSRKIPS